MSGTYLHKVNYIPALFLIICVATLGIQRAVDQPLAEPIELPANLVG